MQPLEVGDDDAAGVAEHIGDEFDVAAGVDDFVGGVSGRPVRRFGEHAAFELGGVFIRDDTFEGRGDEDGALKFEELFVRDRLSAVEIAEDLLVADVF